MPERVSTGRRANEPSPPRGILRAPRPDGLLDGRRVLPSAALAPHVHHFWHVRWSLRTPFTAETLPHPAMQFLAVDEAGRRRAELLGVQTGRVARTLSGEGQVFGISFRPAVLQPLLQGSMASFTDRVVPLVRALGAAATAWTRALHAAQGTDAKIALTEAFLADLLPPVGPPLARVRDLVERVATDRSLVRVEDLCALTGFDARALQRAFRTYVGVSPKWVMQRYRLHEAAEQLRGRRAPRLAALAASLGYADQAHFARDFKRAVGHTPRAFAELTRRADAPRRPS
jgi:AraC-like DNA-binding protein